MMGGSRATHDSRATQSMNEKSPRGMTPCGDRVTHTAPDAGPCGIRKDQATATGILPILACHSFGPVLWTEMPWASTATVTGMSFTSNS